MFKMELTSFDLEELNKRNLLTPQNTDATKRAKHAVYFGCSAKEAAICAEMPLPWVKERIAAFHAAFVLEFENDKKNA
jgi:hypothetical protein